jgi:hypothetical protein
MSEPDRAVEGAGGLPSYCFSHIVRDPSQYELPVWLLHGPALGV